MKKYIFILLLSITLLPILVQADDKSIVLKTISLNKKSDNVEEINPAIIQDNKLVGAITHTIVNNPQKGFGISIEKMLESVK